MRQTIVLFLLPLLSACTTPREAFDQQDFDKAYKLALADLNKGKGGKEEQTILQQSLENILARDVAESRSLSATEKPEDWKAALDINYGLQEKIKEARAFLPGAFEKELYTLPQQAAWLRKKLYAHYFEQGKDNLARTAATGLKAYAQQAHGAFSKAYTYADPPPAELDSLSRVALKKGIVYYTVTTEAPFDVTYNWEINQVFSRLEDQSGGFLRIAFNDPLRNADCAIEIRFSSLEIDIREETGDEDFNREVILEYQTVTDTAGNKTQVPVYGTVEGNVYIITRTKTVTWEADVRVNALTPNCSVSSENFEASAQSVAREVRTSGDERAIPEEYLDAPKEQFIEEDDMVEQILEDLYEQIVRAYF